jgi:hypothetical protein
MKRLAFLAVVACLGVAASSRPARANFVTYDIYQNGTSGTLLAEFTYTGFVNLSTSIFGITLTQAVSGLGTGPGALEGILFSTSDPFPDIEVNNENSIAVGGRLDAVPTSHEFPTSPGTYTLDTSLSQVLDRHGIQINTPDTMVVTETPEPASLTLLGLGVAGIAGYGWRRRR